MSHQVYSPVTDAQVMALNDRPALVTGKVCITDQLMNKLLVRFFLPFLRTSWWQCGTFPQDDKTKSQTATDNKEKP